MFDASKIIRIVKENIEGLDAFTVIPVVDLKKALTNTITRIEKGLIPDIYHWSKEKTEFAYGYKNYKKWVKSIFLAAKYYYTDENNSSKKPECFGKIAKYTQRNNYQYLINRLRETVSFLEKRLNIKIKYKALSNYTSIPEKVLFNFSGLGKIGRNSVLINPDFGSYFVIGELLTDLEINFYQNYDLSPPDFSICGNCTRCIEKCPTSAIIESGVLDVNRCIQFISENLILVDDKIREVWGNRLYGCSTCLDVCPYNQNLKPIAEKHQIGFVGNGYDLIDILTMKEKDWDRAFSDNQIGTRDRLAIIKNAILAIGNLNCTKAKNYLYTLLTHENETIRAYTVWALAKIDKEDAQIYLSKLYKRETSKIVKKEIKKVLEN
ncbi:MAG: hypothetical protein DRP84_08345 [Spirochaetes bacterium]|nr:MAG: hypothetical protein DRP84_08345 [Spirochaetota bacterium]